MDASDGKRDLWWHYLWERGLVQGRRCGCGEPIPRCLTWSTILEKALPEGEADVFLFTSLRDALGAQLLEAAGFGLPMIGLSHQGRADMIPDDVAIKVPILDGPGTAHALARAVEGLIDDRGRRAHGRGGGQVARANTWAERVREVYSIVEPIVDAWPSER
jgi:glycosyltransferase involved in cell wall biosynthesis